jgi:threonylcarbamoyladenosine tRNA methylthiotransferase MtaB
VKYAIVTFGCRVNQADSLQLETELLRMGAEPAPAGRAEVVFVNSCSVTAAADQGTRQTIRRIGRDNPSARLVVTGCYATRRPDEVAALPGVVRVVPNAGKDGLLDACRDLFPDTATRFGGGDGPCGQPLAPGAAGRTAFTLRVQTGCDEICSYCIIPATRGTSRSTPPEAIRESLASAVAAGYREVTLTGVHLGAYGRDLMPSTSLTALVERLLADGPRVRLVLGSLEPMDCTDGLVDLAASGDGLAPAFHLPLQHASDRVLRAMRRPYTLADYARLVDRVRTRLPYASIGTDLIAGFPGETDEDADALLDYLRRSPLTSLHVFPYSDRPGTAAASMPAKVHGAAVRERARRLREVGAGLAARFRRAQHGRVCRALTIDDGRVALADNHLKVHIERRPRNAWITVRLVDEGDGMRGVEEPEVVGAWGPGILGS